VDERWHVYEQLAEIEHESVDDAPAGVATEENEP
jgi:hypothetical protein